MARFSTRRKPTHAASGPIKRGVAVSTLALLALCGSQAGAMSAAGQPAGGAPLAQPPVMVRCTLNFPSTEPCKSEAEKTCKGRAKLLRITMATPIPATEGVNQHTAPQYVYAAQYSCR